MNRGNLLASMLYIGIFKSLKQSIFLGSLLLAAFLCSADLIAQDFKANASVKEKLKEIQESGEYIYGLGHSKTLRKAQELALANLSSQISTNVSSNFEYLMSKETEGDDTQFNEQVNSIIKTYSRTSLKQALQLIVKDEPDATVVRYIKISDLDKVFESRKEKAISFAKAAEKYENESKLADALSYYYWALALLRSCPNGDEMTIRLGLNEEQLLSTYIFNQIKDILHGISVTAVSNTKENDGSRSIGINVNYNGAPAVNFNYTYNNGENRTDINHLQNGEDLLVVSEDFNLSKIDLRAEYICEEEANMDSELRDVLDNTDEVPLTIAKLQIKGLKELNEKNVSELDTEIKLVKTDAVDDANKRFATVEYLNNDESKQYLSIMQNVEKAIRNKNYESVKGLFTIEGYDMFNRLVNYGKARLLKAPEIKFSRLGDEVTCRSFPMSFTFSGNYRKFVEDVVFRINSQGLIFEVAFGLEKKSVDDIMDNGNKNYSVASRQILINFMESYKTAYALARLDYLDKIFSNDAIIITGTVVRETGFGDLKPKNLEHVKYTRQTKSQYLKNLERCFNSNEFVNIHFAETRFKKSTGKEVYGIQLKQDYYSSNYGDTGYLFLLLDLTQPKEPSVKVRAWQPDLDPTIPDGRLDISDFIF